MKKTIALILVLALCFALTACSKPQESAYGYSSMETLMDAYIRMITYQFCTKDEVQRMRTQEDWANAFEEGYEQYVNSVDAQQAQLRELYGSDYRVTWTIVETDQDPGGYYMLVVNIRFQGSLGEKETKLNIYVKNKDGKWFIDA